MFGLFALFLCVNITYADECEIIKCTFKVNKIWSEIIMGHACPEDSCNIKISWTTYSDRITTPFGVVDEKSITMHKGLIKEFTVVKQRDATATIYHNIKQRNDKIIISSHLLSDSDKSELAVPLEAVATKCSIEYKTIAAMDTPLPL